MARDFRQLKKLQAELEEAKRKKDQAVKVKQAVNDELIKTVAPWSLTRTIGTMRRVAD